MTKFLGKIKNVRFGHVGYQNSMLGLDFDFTFNECCGVGADDCFWDAGLIECSNNAKWSEDDRDVAYAKIMRKISKYLFQAKVEQVKDLIGVPVELTFKGGGWGGTLESWRILTEVL